MTSRKYSQWANAYFITCAEELWRLRTFVMPLTPNETRVLDLFDQGKSWKQIAHTLHISIHTARDYGRRIIAKTFTVEMLAKLEAIDAEKNIRGAAHIRRHTRPR